MMIAAEAATFNDSTGGSIGMRHALVRFCDDTRAEAGPSPPSSSAMRPDQSTASGSRPSRGTAAISFRLIVLRMSCITASIETLRATGRRSALPMLPRIAFHENGLRRFAGDDHAGDAAGFRDAHQRAEVAGILDVDDDEREQPRLLENRIGGGRMTMRDGDDTAGRAHGADRCEHAIAGRDDIDAGALQRLRKRILPRFA